MSVQAMAWVLEQAPTNLPPQARLVLIAIANHADKDGRNAWPSYATIAREAGLQRRQAMRWVLKLRDRGLLDIATNEGGTQDTRSDRRPNRYTILPLADGVSPTAPRDATGCHPGSDGVSPTASRGVTGDTRTVLEPSKNQRGGQFSPGSGQLEPHECPTCDGTRWTEPDIGDGVTPCPVCA